MRQQPLQLMCDRSLLHRMIRRMKRIHTHILRETKNKSAKISSAGQHPTLRRQMTTLLPQSHSQRWFLLKNIGVPVHANPITS